MLGILILIIIGIIIVVVLVKAIMFKPKEEKFEPIEVREIDKTRAVESLQNMIRIKTVSYNEEEKINMLAFDEFKAYLLERYPNITKNCDRKLFDKTGILYHYKGKDSSNPTVLMSHYDVVPADESYWTKPAFEGIIEDEVLWGRGTLDTKTTLCAVMESIETLIEDGFIPQNDIYMAFSGDEEINGNGQVEIVKYFKENNISPALVLDEGGAVVEGVFPGMTQPAALIGIAEKGMMNVDFEVKSKGGHASAPPSDTPVTTLAKTVVKLQKNPFKTQMTEPTKLMFDTLGRHSTFGYKILFANLWLFRPILNFICTKKGGELNALMRTTTAFTKMSASETYNVIPPVAKVSANLRLLGNDTADISLNYMNQVISNKDINITNVYSMNPSVCSDVDCRGYDIVKRAVSLTWPEAVVSPYLMIACSDSRHYGEISKKVYRFSAMAMTSEERGTIHGHNERIPLDKIGKAVVFYHRVITQC